MTPGNGGFADHPPGADCALLARRTSLRFHQAVSAVAASGLSGGVRSVAFAPYLGDAVITSETGHQVWQVHFNSGTGLFEVTQIGTFPAQPEDGIFVTADIIPRAAGRPRRADAVRFAASASARPRAHALAQRRRSDERGRNATNGRLRRLHGQPARAARPIIPP